KKSCGTAARTFSQAGNHPAGRARSGIPRVAQTRPAIVHTSRLQKPRIAALSPPRRLEREIRIGWVAEWSNAHAWKACLPQGNEGSNPSPSAPVITMSRFLFAELSARHQQIVSFV